MIAINSGCTVTFTIQATASVELPEDVASVDDMLDDEIVEMLFKNRLGLAALWRGSSQFDVEINEAYDGADD